MGPLFHGASSRLYRLDAAARVPPLAGAATTRDRGHDSRSSERPTRPATVPPGSGRGAAGVKVGEIGRSGGRAAVWHACADCGRERWVLLKRGQPQSARCHPCGAKVAGRKKEGRRTGPRASNWKGGRSVTVRGYVVITVAPDDPFVGMTNKKRHRAVYEHRIVMARHLGRCLDPSEIVHHKNLDKTDNRIENLELCSRSQHSSAHYHVGHYLLRIRELEAEVGRLRAELAGA